MLIQKYKSTNGASIFISLIFLLLCAVAGSVILSAASTSSGRVRTLGENKQSYYSVISAARALESEISGEKYSIYKVLSADKTMIEQGYNQTPQKSMKEFLMIASDKIFSSGEAFSSRWEIESSEDQIGKVIAQFSMDTGYNITILLSQKEVLYRLYVPAIVSKEEDVILTEDEQCIRQTTNVIWSGGNIERN